MIMIIRIKIIFLIISQQLPAPYKRLIDDSLTKTNYEKTTRQLSF